MLCNCTLPGIVNPVMVILKSGLLDEWSEVIKESSKAVGPIIKEIGRVIHPEIDRLTMPLCKDVTHHQSAVRAEAIRAIGLS